MNFSASQIAQLINGSIDGDAAAMVNDFAKIEEAGAQQLAFLANLKYEEYLYTTQATIVIISQSLELKQPVTATLIRVPDAYTAFATLLDIYQQLQSQQLSGIQQPSFIDASATVGEQVFVGAFAYIGKNATIGNGVKIYPQVFIGDNVIVEDGSILHPGVKVYHQCKIGRQVTIHAGAVIGSDGFGFAPQPDGSFKKVPQTGNAVIEDFVEIGANTTIDRATIGSTIIRAGAKIDNLVQIAHNVEIGNNTVIAATSGLRGTTHLGKNIMVGGQAGIVGHLKIADGVRINAQSGVTKSIKQPGSAVTGSPAYDYTASLRSQAAARHLPEMEKRLKELEKQLSQLLQKEAGIDFVLKQALINFYPMYTVTLKIKSAGSIAALQQFVATLPDAAITGNTKEQPLHLLESDPDSPEQEITDVFKTTPDHKVWMPGQPFTREALQNRIYAAKAQLKSGQTITLKEAQLQIEQLKAFQTHGS